VQFALDSVDIVPGWRQRYEALIHRLAAADPRRSRVTEVAPGKMELESVSYDYANQVLHGLALQRAKELDSEVVYLAAWDGRPGDGAGGTASVVQRWQWAGLTVEPIDLAELLRQERLDVDVPDRPAAVTKRVFGSSPPAPETKVLALLFADARGFGRLTEKQAVLFTRHCLGAICKLLLDCPYEAIVRESRGDGVYLALETVREAGLFALRLCELIDQTPWLDNGLPADLKLRIGLHTGPVCRCFDPILGAQTWTRAHVARAARFEPIAVPGQVCSSQQFAALAAVEYVTEFACVYVETRELPKTSGKFPIYAVRRRSQERT
jgi:class 3 adenylate cyclase